MAEQLLKEFIGLEQQKDELEARLKRVTSRLKQLEQPLLDWFGQLGLQRVTIDDRTAYVHRQLWASAKDGDTQGVCDALKDCQLADLVRERFNTNTLSAYVREQDRAGEPLPSALAAVLTVSEVFSLRCVKATNDRLVKGESHGTDEDIPL